MMYEVFEVSEDDTTWFEVHYDGLWVRDFSTREEALRFIQEEEAAA